MGNACAGYRLGARREYYQPMGDVRGWGWLRLCSSALAALLTVSVLASTALAGPGDHGELVPEAPRTGLPVVLDGEVHAHAQIGSRIIVGGEFSQVSLPDNTVVSVSNLFAYDINTGLFDTAFDTVVDDRVVSIAVAPDEQSFYIGGKFDHVDGIYRGRIAQLTPAGNLITAFQANASAEVYSLAASATKLYAGGFFIEVGGQTRLGLAAVDASSGAVDAGFVMNLTQPLRQNRASGKATLLSPDGNTLYSIHNARLVNGVVRAGVAKIDVSGATAVLTGWGTDLFANASCNAITDGAISPDGSFVVVSSWGGDNPPGCDTVSRFDTAGSSFVTRTWTARMYSSVFSVAVSDTAVYAVGHFCSAPRNPIPLGGISSTNPQKFQNCLDPAANDPLNAVPRNQLAALHPDHGQALEWDPGSNAFTAGHDVTVISRGLLYGQDRDRVNGVVVGRSGFFDFGPPEPPPIVVPGAAALAEGAPGQLLVPVTLSKPWAAPVTVSWETFDVMQAGLATPGVDFEAASGVITFAPGETTKFAPLTIIDDTLVEPPLLWGEWGLVRFFDVSANAQLDTSFFGLGIAVIIDND